MACIVDEKTKAIMSSVLECYKGFRVLWDVSDENFSNKDAKSDAYQVMLTIYHKLEPKATAKALRKRLEKMRYSFKRELKRVKDSENKGDKMYVPKLWYFQHLMFLNDTYYKIDSFNEVEREGEDEDEERKSDFLNSILENMVSEDLQQGTSQNGIITPTLEPEVSQHISGVVLKEKPIKRIKLSTRKQERPMDATQLNIAEDEWDITGKSYAIQMKYLNHDQQAIAHKLITDVLFYGKMNKLSMSSSVTLE